MEALEARLRATEERLKINGVRIPIKPTKEPEPELEPELAAAIQENKASSRLTAAKNEGHAVPGAQPLTPSASDAEEAELEDADDGKEEDDDEDEESEDERPATADLAKRRKRAQSLGRRLHRHFAVDRQG